MDNVITGLFYKSTTNDTGLTTFIYQLDGSETFLLEFKRLMAGFYKDEFGILFYNTLFYIGEHIEFSKTFKENKYFPNNEALDKAFQTPMVTEETLYRSFFNETKDENWLKHLENKKTLEIKRKSNL